MLEFVLQKMFKLEFVLLKNLSRSWNLFNPNLLDGICSINKKAVGKCSIGKLAVGICSTTVFYVTKCSTVRGKKVWQVCLFSPLHGQWFLRSRRGRRRVRNQFHWPDTAWRNEWVFVEQTMRLRIQVVLANRLVAMRDGEIGTSLGVVLPSDRSTLTITKLRLGCCSR